MNHLLFMSRTMHSGKLFAQTHTTSKRPMTRTGKNSIYSAVSNISKGKHDSNFTARANSEGNCIFKRKHMNHTGFIISEILWLFLVYPATFHGVHTILIFCGII